MRRPSLRRTGALALVLACLLAGRAGAVETSAAAAILMDVDSGRVLYERNADARMLIASTTKIMTALVAIRDGDLSDTVKVSREAAYTEGSSMYLKEGEELTFCPCCTRYSNPSPFISTVSSPICNRTSIPFASFNPQA